MGIRSIATPSWVRSSTRALSIWCESIQRLKDEGGEVLYGGERSPFLGERLHEAVSGSAKPDFEIVKHETFGPLLYLMTYRDFDEAIAIHNDVPQGLTSSIFTNDVREAEKFVSAIGQRLRNRQREHRHQRCGDRRRVRRRKTNRWRSREWQRFAGRATCGARPTRSISRASCRWRREFEFGAGEGSGRRSTGAGILSERSDRRSLRTKVRPRIPRLGSGAGVTARSLLQKLIELFRASMFMMH